MLDGLMTWITFYLGALTAGTIGVTGIYIFAQLTNLKSKANERNDISMDVPVTNFRTRAATDGP
jgi:hypothetical protein